MSFCYSPIYSCCTVSDHLWHFQKPAQSLALVSAGCVAAASHATIKLFVFQMRCKVTSYSLLQRDDSRGKLRHARLADTFQRKSAETSNRALIANEPELGWMQFDVLLKTADEVSDILSLRQQETRESAALTQN